MTLGPKDEQPKRKTKIGGIYLAWAKDEVRSMDLQVPTRNLKLPFSFQASQTNQEHQNGLNTHTNG